MGSTSVVTAPNGGLRARTLYKPFGEVRYQSGVLPTEYTFTGQYSHVDDFGLMYYGARWYDPALGRFVQADTVVPGMHPMAFDRYAYVMNNPIRYIDPTGHWSCGDQYDPSCADTPQETAQYQIMEKGYQPGSACASDPLCSDIYDTMVEVTVLLGHAPTMEEILYMTAATEYYVIAIDHPKVRAVGQEALARNYYEACETDGCYGNELYAFLAGFQPWYGRPYVIDGTPRERATHLVGEGFDNDFSGKREYLETDVKNILAPKYAGRSGRQWTEGKDGDSPWQWYGPFLLNPDMRPTYGDGAENAAILSVDMGNGYVFWMFTGFQDWNFAHNKSHWEMSK